MAASDRLSANYRWTDRSGYQCRSTSDAPTAGIGTRRVKVGLSKHLCQQWQHGAACGRAAMLVPSKWLLAGVRFRESRRRFAFFLEPPRERGTGEAPRKKTKP
jgi:hypothetical protein